MEADVCKRLNIVADETTFSEAVKSRDFDNFLNDNTNLTWIEIDYSKWTNRSESWIVNDAIVWNRPWWAIVQEDYGFLEDKETRAYITLIQRVSEFSESLLRNIASIQYPYDCAKTPMHIRTIYGYSEYGNKAYDTSNQFVHTFNNGAAYVFQVRQDRNSPISFLDAHFCDNIANKWNCVFLPSTNCTLPKACYENIGALQTDGKNCTRLVEEYSSSTSDATLLALDYVKRPFFRFPHPRQPYTVYHFNGRYLNYSSVIQSSASYSALFTHLLPMIMQRANHNYRHLISKEIRRSRRDTNPHFGKQLDCVAIHSRRNDRALPNMTADKYFEWCNKFQHLQDGTCLDMYNNTRECVFHYIGLACDLIPFGAIELDDYLRAAAIISPKNRNIVIMTDDSNWIEREKRRFPDWHIFAIHGSNIHSKASTANGVNFFASVEAMTQCTAFIGHQRSAIYNLVMMWMCSYHGPRANRIFGKCPTVFDFGNIEKS